MSDFAGMEDLLQDFLIEATDLLSGVDNKLVDLEKNPQDHGLLNDIFRPLDVFIDQFSGIVNQRIKLNTVAEAVVGKVQGGVEGFEIKVEPERLSCIHIQRIFFHS